MKLNQKELLELATKGYQGWKQGNTTYAMCTVMGIADASHPSPAKIIFLTKAYKFITTYMNTLNKFKGDYDFILERTNPNEIILIREKIRHTIRFIVVNRKHPAEYFGVGRKDPIVYDRGEWTELELDDLFSGRNKRSWLL